MKRYQLAKPHIGKAEERAVLRVLRSGILSIGPEIKSFEKKFAEIVGTKFACAVSSGTTGLHMAMIAAGVQKGDEVITSPFSFIASANAVLYVGAKPVFVDVDPHTFNMNPALIEAKITKKTKAILVVHIFGQAADMGPIMKIARRHNLIVLEDACESLNAEYHGRKVGTFGQSAVFAFYANKQMTTGEGGMLVTNSEKIYRLCQSLRNQGRAANMQWLDHERLGYNYRMDEMSAALGVTQLEKLDFLIGQKERIADHYTKQFALWSQYVTVPHVAPGNMHTWFVYVIRIKNPRIKRDAIIATLEKEGISTKAYLPSLHRFSFYKKMFGYRKGDFPISESISDSTLALPFYIGLTEKDIRHITKTVIRVVRDHEKHL